MFRGLKQRLTSATTSRSDSTSGTSSHSQGGATRNESKTSFRVSLRKQKDSNYDVPLLKSKVTHLASFDACVEAADGLAVEGSSVPQQTDGLGLSTLSRKHSPSGLPDPSVLVSVDGNLLFIPPVKDLRTVFQKKSDNDISKDNENGNQSDDDERTPTFSNLMMNGKDDYESAVFLGNDIEGDKKLNGFSAMGWSLPATSYALGQTEVSLQNLVTFTENILLNKKETAARTCQACDLLREFMPSLGGRSPVPAVRTNKPTERSGHSRPRSNLGDDWEIVDPRANEFVPNAVDRTGPLAAPGSSVDHALVVLEEYFSQYAELEGELCREFSTQRNSVLPKLRESFQRVSQRIQHRDEALEQASQRARLLEERLQGLRVEAEHKWEKVYKTEEKVQARLEALWQERSRQREKARLDRLQKESELAMADVQQQSTQDILSLVAQISEDTGSFEPMELGINTPERKIGKSVDSFFDEDMSGTETPPAQQTPTNALSPGTITISREDVEQEFRLPELRAAALHADEKVEDASQDLLQALSNFDTTRRAARVVAETVLVNAANAQVDCIKQLVALERKAIEQRLELVKKLEDSLPTTNVREDLDNYITKDKKERGGTSHLGDDDDGGIASALAVLSSHVDSHNEGEMRVDDEQGTTEDTSISREDIISALDQFFVDEPESVDQSVELLCKIASSPNSRSRRSTICYALNSKRGVSASIPTKSQFEGLCKVFSSVLTSYVSDETGMANAKMLMMLAQTFYHLDSRDPSSTDPVEASPSRPKREKRIYVRNRLTGHAIWSNDAFWDEAFRTAMTESLTVSGVMSNFERTNQMVHAGSDYRKSKGGMMKWYDLNYEERIGAASQVHAVIFAQLGALAHSMIEFGCGLHRSCAFVRRCSIRNQLPTAQRTMLLQHLMTRNDAELIDPPNLNT